VKKRADFGQYRMTIGSFRGHVGRFRNDIVRYRPKSFKSELTVRTPAEKEQAQNR
jgi:hypothetical protein